jgi:hypothetical protein
VNHQRIELSTGTLDVYDNAVPLFLSQQVYEFLTKPCGWYLGWNDIAGSEPNLHARIEEGYPKCFEIVDQLNDRKEFIERMTGLKSSRVIANLSHASSVHHKHTHSEEELVILYYANLKWQEHWEGETLFYGEDGEIELASKYTPGRIIVFNAKTPHSIRAQSPAGPPFRFTISYFWNKIDQLSS